MSKSAALKLFWPGRRYSAQTVAGMLAAQGVREHVFIRLEYQDRLLGMVVASGSGHKIPPEDVALLAGLRHVLALAIHNASAVASAANGKASAGAGKT